MPKLAHPITKQSYGDRNEQPPCAEPISLESGSSRKRIKLTCGSSVSNMLVTNPYALAGWPNPLNPLAQQTPRDKVVSLYGALPFAPTTTPCIPTVSFQFTSFSPDLLNCVVIGSRFQPYYRVITRPTTDGASELTSIHNCSTKKTFATIQWSPQRTTVEIDDTIPKQSAAAWVALSADKRCVEALRSSQVALLT